MHGICKQDNLFELKQGYEIYHVCHDKIADCDKRIKAILKEMADKTNNVDNTPRDNNRRKANGRNKIDFDASSYLNDILGVDLTEFFGISELTVAEILSEIGTDMPKWATKICLQA